jgi:hypothetical protein
VSIGAVDVAASSAHLVGMKGAARKRSLPVTAQPVERVEREARQIIAEGPLPPHSGDLTTPVVTRAAAKTPARFVGYVTHAGSTKGEIEHLDRLILNWLEDHRSRGVKVTKHVSKKRNVIEFRAGRWWNRHEVQIVADVWPLLHKSKTFFEGDESTQPSYTGSSPSPEAAVTPPLRMPDDFNTALIDAGASLRVSASYEVLARHVDLDNPALSDAERLTRARRLVRSYERQREKNPAFEDHSPQLLAAFSILNKVKYQRRKEKKLAL